MLRVAKSPHRQERQQRRVHFAAQFSEFEDSEEIPKTLARPKKVEVAFVFLSARTAVVYICQWVFNMIGTNHESILNDSLLRRLIVTQLKLICLRSYYCTSNLAKKYNSTFQPPSRKPRPMTEIEKVDTFEFYDNLHWKVFDSLLKLIKCHIKQLKSPSQRQLGIIDPSIPVAQEMQLRFCLYANTHLHKFLFDPLRYNQDVDETSKHLKALFSKLTDLEGITFDLYTILCDNPVKTVTELVTV